MNNTTSELFLYLDATSFQTLLL